MASDLAATEHHPRYNPEVKKFFAIASEGQWTDYDYDPSAMAAIYRDDGAIAAASLDQIKSLITYCVRAERFCDGAWKTLITSGGLQRILERLRTDPQRVLVGT